MGNKAKESIGKAVFGIAAVICIIAVIAIFAFLIVKSIPAFGKLGVFDFVFGDNWSPDRNDTLSDPSISGRYGIFSMIVGTLAVAVGALLFGGVLGYFTAVFIVFFCPRRLKRLFSSVVNLLAGIPSVVYGFFGIVFLLPLLSNFAPNNGSGLLATSIILGIMILPTVVSLSKTSLEAVPRQYYEGAVALGATHTEAALRIVVPAARSGIVASLVLGVGRALGETMAVVMVAGNAPTYPNGLFNSFRVMTANIVMEMGYAGELQEGALIATGVVLLIFILIVNLIFGAISNGFVKRLVQKRDKKGKEPRKKLLAPLLSALESLAYKVRLTAIGKGMAICAGVISGISLVLIIGFVFVNGLPNIITDPHLLFGKYEFGSERITILPSIVATLMAVVLALIVAVPVGIMTAVFLNEYTKKSNLFVKMIRTAIDILSGVPSIVYGLFGMISFVRVFGGSSSIVAGSLTVSIMLIPTIVRSTEESLRAVPSGLKEGSFALGAGKLRTIFKIIIPGALPGIMSAVILSMGRVVSESAPFLYTMGSVISAVPNDYFDSGATLAVALYQLSGEGWYIDEAYGAAVVLIVIVFALNMLAEFIGGRLTRKLKGV